MYYTILYHGLNINHIHIYIVDIFNIYIYWLYMCLFCSSRQSRLFRKKKKTQRKNKKKQKKQAPVTLAARRWAMKSKKEQKEMVLQRVPYLHSFPTTKTPSLRTSSTITTHVLQPRPIPCCNAVPMKGILTAFLAGIGKGLVRGFVPVRCVGSQP